MLTLCESLDQIATIEAAPTHFPRGLIRPLYEASRGDGPPITYRIAMDMARFRSEGRTRVALVTGLFDPVRFPVGESDGPLGAVALAWGLANLGWKPAILTEPTVVEPIRALLGGIGQEAPVMDLGKYDEEGLAALADLFDVAVFIEKPGSSPAGLFHSVLGYRYDREWAAELKGFLNEMTAQEKLTVGIGDGGNEIGFGRVYDFAREIVPWGKECRCQAQDGIITDAKTTHLFPVGVSNWGAYAVYAALSALETEQPAPYSGDMEKRLVEMGTRLGLRDGGTGELRACVDGVPVQYVAALVDLMNGLVHPLFTTESRDF